jgi:serine phosphatase RsbU (regulator of sigma subunit)
MRAKHASTDRAREWFHTYTRDLSGEDLQRLFTHDTRDAYEFFARGLDTDQFANMPWWKAFPLRVRQFFLAFTLRLPPARRLLYIGAVAIALIGLLQLFRQFEAVNIPLGTPFIQIPLPVPVWENGTFTLIVSLLLFNLLVLLEVADRLSLKGELEVAREIQLAMLPRGTYAVGDLEVCGLTRPANTVGGDFYDVLPLPDGTIVMALGDVAGKGSPAALLMALLLAVLRTLVDERLPAEALAGRLNAQISRHSPGSRFITLFLAFYQPSTGELTYVNAGQNPPLLRRSDGSFERLTATGMALGMFEGASYSAVSTRVDPGNLLVLYSDGLTEAEDPTGRPLEESGLESLIARNAAERPAALGAHLLAAVEAHAQRSKLLDDLTVLILKRAA